MRGEFLIFGHRGSPRRHPENSIESFEATIAAGADGFETDLRLLSDLTPVLYHDDELRGDAVESLTVAGIAQRGAIVPRVSDLARFAGRTRMILEVKRGSWEELLLREIEGWPGVVVASFDHRVIAELVRRKPGIEVGITLSGAIVDLASYASRLGVQWVYPDYRFVDAPMVSSLRECGIAVVPWTPNRVPDWERMREAGCAGVITDVPEDAVAWRDGQRGDQVPA